MSWLEVDPETLASIRKNLEQVSAHAELTEKKLRGLLNQTKEPELRAAIEKTLRTVRKVGRKVRP